MASHTLTFRSALPVATETALAWHARPGAFERLTPGWAPVRVVEARGGIEPGATRTLRFGRGPFGMEWSLRHVAAEGFEGFADEQIRGPFASWNHEHRFSAEPNERSLLEDRLTYTLPLGALGSAVAGGYVQTQLEETFRFRHDRTRNDLALHQRYATERPLKIAVTGATGMIGRQLSAFLTTGGHEVIQIVRKSTGAQNEILWDPAAGQIDTAALEGVDAVIHLAGTSIAGGRWTKSRKESILRSRVDGTTLLATTLAGLQRKPSVFVSTSAVGYYGDAGQTKLMEDAPKGDGFLADVCEAWEQAANPAQEAGIRVVHPRFGIVLSGSGGMLPLIAKAFSFGVGGRLGSGNQAMSWIAIDDLMGILLASMVDESLNGPVNAVSPEFATNLSFTKTLGKVLRRPTIFPVPAPALRLVAGQLGDELLLASQAAVPAVLQERGFPFAYSSLEETLRHELGRYRGQGGADAVTSS